MAIVGDTLWVADIDVVRLRPEERGIGKHIRVPGQSFSTTSPSAPTGST
jgi:hypothetical protein